MAKQQWAVFATVNNESSGYQHLVLTFKRVQRSSATREFQEAVKFGGSVEYYEQRLNDLIRTTGEDKYFGSARRDSFEIRWQANNGAANAFGERCTASEWYGPQIDRAELSAAVGRAIVKLSGEYRLTPAQAIEVLRAQPVRYQEFPQGSGEYVADEDFELPESPKQREQQAQAS